MYVNVSNDSATMGRCKTALILCIGDYIPAMNAQAADTKLGFEGRFLGLLICKKAILLHWKCSGLKIVGQLNLG